jgi:hypothetical protein
MLMTNATVKKSNDGQAAADNRASKRAWVSCSVDTPLATGAARLALINADESMTRRGA